MSVGAVLAYILSAILLLVIGRIFLKPLMSLLVLVLHSLLGGVGLYIFNLIFRSIGFTIGLNPVTASVCGLFGLPGLVLLVLLKLLFAI
ncbi:MAG: pro-sigmaK processing inhibitor BofA family protein [Clostridia bacterium]|nr:pro-sigmaK processing inhibitor BofA family protein [Clostridia bacterium]